MPEEKGSPHTSDPQGAESFDALLDAKLNAAGEDISEIQNVARWAIDRAAAGDVPAMLIVIETVDGPAEEAEPVDD